MHTALRPVAARRPLPYCIHNARGAGGPRARAVLGKPLWTEIAQRIPRVLFQSAPARRVPPRLFAAARSWWELNPEYEYRFFDDDAMRACRSTTWPPVRSSAR